MTEIKAKFVLINAQTGSVMWYNDYAEATRARQQYGGTLIDTTTADSEYLARCLENARRNQ